MKVAKQKGGSDFTKFNYDSRNPFVICGASLTPIYAGKPRIVCSFCNASYQNNYLGSVCTICELAEVGKKGTGLELMIKSKNMK
jgi:coatomer protein complex subunit alpha (xenin)